MSSSVERASRPRRRVAGERMRPRQPEAAPRREAAAPTAGPPAAVTPRHTAPAARVRAKPAPGSPSEGPPAEEAPDRRRLLAPAIAAGVAAALLAMVAAVSLNASSAQPAQTRAATSAARTSIEQMLSYNYRTIDAQAAQIETLLTGSFKQEFAQAMDRDIKPLAVKNKTVVQARVSDVGVMDEADGRVKVLAFVNQATVGAEEKQPAIDQNRVIATLTRVGDRWLVSDVQAF